jgi:hypothetical protein
MKHILFVVVALFIKTLVSGQEIVVSSLTDTGRLFLSGNILYYSHEDKVSFIDITESNPTSTLLISGLSNPTGMALKDNFLYVAQYDADNIIKLDLSLPNPIPIVVTSFSSNYNMLVIVDNVIYYTNNQVGAVLQYDITTDTASGLVPGLNGPIGITHKDGLLYIGDAGDGKIYTFEIANPSAGVTEIASGLDRPIGIEFKEDELYIADFDDQKIVKFNITNNPIIIEDVITNLDLPGDIALSENIIYIMEDTRISKYELTLSIDEFDFSKTRLYPNPANHNIGIAGIKEKTFYNIYESVGRKISQGELSPNQKIDVSNLYSGSYFVKLKSESRTFRFIKI